MSDICVVVADGSRARFFTLESPEVPEVESGPRLVERSDLVNPEATLSGRETWRDDSGRNSGSDAGHGRSSAPGGGPAHGYDDHRDAHAAEMGRRFAKHISAAAVEMAGRQGAKCLVLVAANRMLGFLRETLQVPPGGVEVREAAKDLTPLSPQDIHKNLRAAGLLPARTRPHA